MSAVAAHLENMRQRGLSARTIDSRRCALARLAAWLEADGKKPGPLTGKPCGGPGSAELLQATPADLAAWRASLHVSDVAVAAYARVAGDDGGVHDDGPAGGGGGGGGPAGPRAAAGSGRVSGMGRVVTLTWVTREHREDAELDLDAHIAAITADKARNEGYHPAGEPRLDWHEMSEPDVMMYYDALGLAYDPDDESAPVRPGDWQVRAVIRVAEDTELREAAG